MWIIGTWTNWGIPGFHICPRYPLPTQTGFSFLCKMKNRVWFHFTRTLFFLRKNRDTSEKPNRIKNNNPSKHLRFVASSPISEEVVDIQNQNCIVDWLHAKLDQLILLTSGATTLFHYSLSPVHFLTSILPLVTEGHTANRTGQMRNINTPAVPTNCSAWGWESHGGELLESWKWSPPMAFEWREFVELPSQWTARLCVGNSMRWQ